MRRLVAAQFPEWADLPIEPVAFGGWDNRTFHLGDAMSVRLPSAKRYSAQPQKEQRWLPRLAPHLPLPIPEPLAMGVPGDRYPWNWSVYRWLDGENATFENIADPQQFAITLSQFLTAFYRIDPTAGPPPGPHNFFRGGALSTYDTQSRDAISVLRSEIDAQAATAMWETALGSTWQKPPVWVHGDVSAGNLLVTRGRLSAVIDFGCSAVGDPACDLTIAWTLFHGDSRAAFRAGLLLDDATWARARGWALWKALITLVKQIDADPLESGDPVNMGEAAATRRLIEDLLAER